VTPKKIKRRLNHFSFKYLWPLFPAIILIALVIFLSKLKIFNLRKITCNLDSHPCSLEFEPILVNLYQQNIFKLDKKTLVNQLTQFDSTLTNISITKKLPDSVDININRRTAIAQVIQAFDLQFEALNSTASATISANLLTEVYKLDRHGELFSVSTQLEPQLQKIIVASSHQLTQGKSTTSKLLANLLLTLKDHYVNTETIALLSSNQIVIRTQLGPYAILNSDQPLNSTVASLQYVLTNIKIDLKLPSKIDLRFDKPILTY
jgi:hypothetical protein